MIYSLSRVNQWWRNIILQGYFIRSTCKFSVDEYLNSDLVLFNDDDTKRAWDRLYPVSAWYDKDVCRVNSIMQIYCKRKLSNLKKLIDCMKSSHGPLENIEILEIYCLSDVEQADLIISLSELFPNIKLLRGYFYNNFKVINNFVNLKQVFIANGNTYLVQELQKLYTNIDFLLADEITSKLSLEMVQAEATDENMLHLLENHPFLLDMWVNATYSVLEFALIKKFNKCIKYIMKNKSDLLFKMNYRYPYHVSKLSRTEDREILDLFLTKIVEMSHKSDEYFKDIVSRSFYYTSLLHIGNIKDTANITKKKYNIDQRFIRHQSLTLCSELNVSMPKDIPDCEFKKYSKNTLLHKQCHPNYQLNIDLSLLEKDAFVLNNDEQNILHFICYHYSEWYDAEQQCRKYQVIKDHVPNFEKLLFMENGMGLVPLQLLIESRRLVDVERWHILLKNVCIDMFNYNKEESFEIFRKLPKNYTLFYLISNSIGTPYLDNISFFTHFPLTDASPRKQLNYAFEQGLIDLKLNIYSYGNTWLFNTIEGYLMQCFVYYGGDVNYQNALGDTALHGASSKCVANLLISLGADPDIVNENGVSARQACGTTRKKRTPNLKLCKKCFKFLHGEKALEQHEKSHK